MTKISASKKETDLSVNLVDNKSTCYQYTYSSTLVHNNCYFPKKDLFFLVVCFSYCSNVQSHPGRLWKTGLVDWIKVET